MNSFYYFVTRKIIKKDWLFYSSTDKVINKI